MEKLNCVEIHRRLCAVYSPDKVMKQYAYKWITCFNCSNPIPQHDMPHHPSQKMDDNLWILETFALAMYDVWAHTLSVC